MLWHQLKHGWKSLYLTNIIFFIFVFLQGEKKSQGTLKKNFGAVNSKN